VRAKVREEGVPEHKCVMKQRRVAFQHRRKACGIAVDQGSELFDRFDRKIEYGTGPSGVRCLVFGVWCLVFGVWCLVFGVWCWIGSEPCCRQLDRSSRQ
jgi:hypothetical protein